MPQTVAPTGPALDRTRAQDAQFPKWTVEGFDAALAEAGVEAVIHLERREVVRLVAAHV